MALNFFQMEEYLSRVHKIHIFILLFTEFEAKVVPSTDVLIARSVCVPIK